MKRMLLSLAVAGALAAPLAAQAQQSAVQIYGRANLGLDSYSATGATAGSAADYKSRNRIYDNGSRLGFRGTEDLGGGLRGIFLMESGVNIDSGSTTGQSGAPNPSTGNLSSRIGYVGLNGAWGQLTFGRNNVFWGNGTIEQVGSNYINAGSPVFTGSLGRGMAVGITRQSNLLQYTSPVLSGFNAIVSYSPHRAEAAAAGANANAKLWGLTLQGSVGPVALGYDWVQDEANVPAAPARQGKTTGNKFRIGWTYTPGGQISLIVVSSRKENGGAAATYGGLPDAAATSLKQTGWGLNWEHMFGNFQALAQYGKVDDITGCVTAGACSRTNGTQQLVALRYLFSKRTVGYVSFQQVRNDANYNMDQIGASMTSAASGTTVGLPAASVGADPRIAAIGVVHNF